jgi:hypothetical protein
VGRDSALRIIERETVAEKKKGRVSMKNQMWRGITANHCQDLIVAQCSHATLLPEQFGGVRAKPVSQGVLQRVINLLLLRGKHSRVDTQTTRGKIYRAKRQ